MTNFLFVNHNANAPAYGNPYRTFSMAKHLVRLGHSVTVVAAGYSHLRQSQPQQASTMISETHEGVTFLFLPTAKITNKRWSRVRNIGGFLRSYNKYRNEIGELAKPDIVMEATTHILPFFVSAQIASRWHAKLIYEVRDLWPVSPIEISGKSRFHPFFVLIHFAQKYAVKHSDCVVSTLKYADDYFRINVCSPSKFKYIQNGIDVDLFSDEYIKTGNIFNKVKKIKSKYDYVVGYTGGMGPANGLDSLIGAACILEKNNIGIILIGEGVRKKELQSMVQEMKVDNVYFFDSVPKSEIIPITELFDLGFVGGVYRSFHAYGSSPNKVFDYMMCGTPFLYCIDTRDDFVEQAGCGIVVKKPTLESIADAALEFFAKTPDERKAIGNRGRSVAKEKYDYKILTQSFLRLSDELLTAV